MYYHHKHIPAKYNKIEVMKDWVDWLTGAKAKNHCKRFKDLDGLLKVTERPSFASV